MATVHANESYEEVNVQCEDRHDKISKKHILLGAAGVIAVAAVVYAIIKKNNPNK